MGKKSRPSAERKIKYLTQRDKYSCSLIAILNILRWSGKPAPYTYLKCLHTIFDIQNIEGMWTTDTHKLLHCIRNITSIRNDRIKISDIDQALDKNKIVLLAHPIRRNEGHSVLIVSRQGKKYRLVNSVYTKDYLYRYQLSRLLQRKWSDKSENKAWIIDKRKK